MTQRALKTKKYVGVSFVIYSVVCGNYLANRTVRDTSFSTFRVTSTEPRRLWRFVSY